MVISRFNYPDIIQMGDVTKIRIKDFKEKIHIISAGSPCQQFSIAGSRRGMTTTEKIDVTTLKQYLRLKKEGFKFVGQSYLFWEFIRLVHELKPKYFFLENVNMSNKWKYIITKELGVLPITINSSTVSGQNRERLYWTNIPGVSQPKDKKIHISKIIPNAIGGYGIRGVDKGKKKPNGKIIWEQVGTTRKDGKANCITTGKGACSKVELSDGTIRQITVQEAEKLQTLPRNYTKIPGVSQTARWRAIGNGWTIDVIVHLLKGLK